MDKAELLKILDISEDEQQIWLIKNEVMVGAVLQCKGGGELPCPSESLADLAFRFRDEANPEAYCDTLDIVYQNWIARETKNHPTHKLVAYSYWIAVYITPIDMIITALIAKDKNRKEKEMKFVIMKSGFGDLWIGKFDETKVDLPKNAEAFDDYDNALGVALDLAESNENQDELEYVEKEEIEELDDEMLQWIAQ